MGCHITAVRFHTYAVKCDECMKHRRGWRWSYEYHFETMDGGDYLWHDECLFCHIKGMVCSITYALKKVPSHIRTFFECWSYMTKLPWYSRLRVSKAISLTKKLIKNWR